MTNQQDRVLIFDTTLRDGEQSPGATMTLAQKLEISETLDRMGVDIIEAGFPNASPGDFAAVREVSANVEDAVVCALARSVSDDIDRAGEALAGARNPRIHTFIATSPIHMQHKLQMSPEDVLEAIRSAVTRARSLTDNVQWSPEDGTRSEHDFLCRAVETALKAGATTINIPDTVGYTVPNESADIIRMLRERVPGIENAVISTHCHNDLGMAVANSLAAVNAGARQIECTINGLGERAGNAALEEVVMAMRVRNDVMPYQTRIDSSRIMHVSRMVSEATQFPVQFNKAIVGKNAFAHEAGIHQDGMLKNAGTYEIMRPEDVGIAKTNLVMGKHSGRAALREKLAELGYRVGTNRLNDVFAKYKALADKKREVFEDDLIALMQSSASEDANEYLRLRSVSVSCGTNREAFAELGLTVDGEHREVSATGDGPLDAAFSAVKKVFPHSARLSQYHVNAVTEGTDAQATASIRLVEDGRIVVGQAADTDTIQASVLAYVNALNSLASRRQKRAPGAV
ncbi:MAG: 2-isopropylmalate synthase [Rhodobacteraceae bacterium]|nr:2-isopropylmalate synthase [Paracoccaceae bacterium]